ncbi:SAUR-like auxin-responsive protein family [Striga asiatica]|uniref:SAUR-like auxin-responsive protein family n=1 Tax=Striga asiatica TaxID=4170 RepID=A0A5A7QS38_STRAF|nr:SAUR-like auxin-responsive protein family [Striga asiatica]
MSRSIGGGVGRREAAGVPKGCLAVTIGREEEERRRFVIPVAYVNHPLFARLLGEAEEEYGFEQEGPINIPCHVEEFCHVRGLIDRVMTTSHHHHGGGGHHHQFLCFKA